MSYISKPFEELDIMDDFLMNALASDPEIREEFCRTLVSSLLQCELGKIRISVQRSIPSNQLGRRGIRMDVEIVDYEDGLHFLYFYTGGNKGGCASVKKLLNYMQKSTIDNVTDEVTKKLHECVSKIKVLPETRFEYMIWEEKVFYLRRDAKEEGLLEERIRLVSAKLTKGKSLEQIADELELTLNEINELIPLIHN